MFTTNSPVSSVLPRVSLGGSPSGRGPTLMQSIGGLPSVQNDKNCSRIEFRAYLTESNVGLELTRQLSL